jgi:hypothetical protein
VVAKVGDVDGTCMMLRVEQGKGRSPQLLALLRAWWREGLRRGVMLPQAGCSQAATGQPADETSAQPRRPRRRRGGRDQQAEGHRHGAL